jgi:hypothetical protein
MLFLGMIQYAPVLSSLYLIHPPLQLIIRYLYVHAVPVLCR